MYEVSKEIGFRIAKLRRKIRKSREQLAFDIGISQQQLWKYESGISRIVVDRLVIIADALGVRIIDLFFEKDFDKIEKQSTLSKKDYQILTLLRRMREKQIFLDDLLMASMDLIT